MIVSPEGRAACLTENLVCNTNNHSAKSTDHAKSDRPPENACNVRFKEFFGPGIRSAVQRENTTMHEPDPRLPRPDPDPRPDEPHLPGPDPDPPGPDIIDPPVNPPMWT